MEFKKASLPPSILHIVLDKGTEHPFTGEYNEAEDVGTYLCRLCGLALFRSQTKFHSGCGWPSFDEEIQNAVWQVPDKDGRRTEILCHRCHAHLGHVFQGEHMTLKNRRHCVNSLSLDFVKDYQVIDTQEAIFAAGCFWGVEYLFQKLAGVLKTEVGYIGGFQSDPTYEDVCRGDTGHVEAIRVVFDPSKITFEELAIYFFEIHDFSQQNGQGPDRGDQYLSRIFVFNEDQEKVAKSLITRLISSGFSPATRIQPMKIFWRAEEYHQNYYAKTGKHPYCHHHVKGPL